MLELYLLCRQIEVIRPCHLITNIQNLINYSSQLFQRQKKKCFAAIGNDESVKIATTQSDSVFNLFQFSISEVQIAPIP